MPTPSHKSVIPKMRKPSSHLWEPLAPTRAQTHKINQHSRILLSMDLDDQNYIAATSIYTFTQPSFKLFLIPYNVSSAPGAAIRNILK